MRLGLTKRANGRTSIAKREHTLALQSSGYLDVCPQGGEAFASERRFAVAGGADGKKWVRSDEGVGKEDTRGGGEGGKRETRKDGSKKR